MMPHYGSEDGGDFNEVSKPYKKDPSIENYVRLRRQNPDAEIEIGVMGGFDSLLFMEPELKQFGIDPDLVAGVMDADSKAIGELSLQLMERMIEARKLSKEGKTHLASRGLTVPDKFMNWLIAVMLDSLSWNDSLEIPRELIVLIRERLGGSNPDYRQQEHANEERKSAVLTGGRLMAMGEKPSFRRVGKILGKSASTVKRWFPAGDFLKKVEKASKLFDKSGAVR